MARQVEVLVVGAGAGGCVAAIRSAQLGKKTPVVERQWLGVIFTDPEFATAAQTPEDGCGSCSRAGAHLRRLPKALRLAGNTQNVKSNPPHSRGERCA